ncbi:hypothetical protein Dimus_009652 [Dionaea muscipula]
MKLVVEILTGSLFYIQVDDDASLADLKREIADQENFLVGGLVLYLYDDQSGLMIGDNLHLKEFGVCDSSHIYLLFTPLDDADEENDVSSAHLDPCFAMIDDPLVPMEGIKSGHESGGVEEQNEQESPIEVINID